MLLRHRFRFEHLFWINAKVALVCWGALYLFNPPERTHEELGVTLVVIAALFVIVGAIASIVGMVMSTSDYIATRFRGLAIETSGLIFATCGPLSFFTIQVIRIGEGEVYLSRALFSYVLASFMVARTWMLISILRRRKNST